jgi:hypothetical protein
MVSLLVPKSLQEVRQEKAINAILSTDPKLSEILQKAIAGVAKSIHFKDEQQTEKLRLFFVSCEAEAIVRQIYGLYFAPELKERSEPSIRTEFLLSMALYLDVDTATINETADSLFSALIAGCEVALHTAIEKGMLVAHEAKSAVRHRVVLDELASVKRNIELLQQPVRPNLKEILEFEVKYRRQIADRHGHITPPHFDVARKIPIKEICISPALVKLPRARSEQPRKLNFNFFISEIYRAVVLGTPGGGKSTLAGRICHDAALDGKSRSLAGRQLTAILVILRDYGASKKDHEHSFLQFIETTANSHYQVLPPKHAIEYMLLNGRAMVVFDGLDELLDTSHRQEISADIESFCNLYPSVPVLVTSREVGYEQAPLDENRFSVYQLAPFDDEQVQEYVQKWFATDRDLTIPQQKSKAQTFLQESRVVEDIRANPLMLALMCNIYRGENYIPKNRPDIYEKCATMLFERWDKSRGIFLPLPFEAHINPTMKYLAHWIYADDRLQAGVTEDKLVGKASEYLSLRRFEDRDEAERAARDFIQFCRGRAWVFTDTGTTKTGESLYQFTHRTFLEYFTAAHLVRTNPTPDKLIEILLPHIASREWDVVAQLAFQLQNKQVEEAGDRLLASILEQASKADFSESSNLLSFAARALEFLVPSPKTTREVAIACIERVFLLAEDKPQLSATEPKSWEPSPYASLLGDLLSATSENRSPISDCVEKEITKRINDTSESLVLLAADVGLNIHLAFHFTARQSLLPQENYTYWNEVSRKIFDNCRERFRELLTKDCCLSIQCFFKGNESISKHAERFGIRGLFAECTHPMFPNITTSSVASYLLWAAMHSVENETTLEISNKRLPELAIFSGLLLGSRTPWMKKFKSNLITWRHWAFDPEAKAQSVVLDRDQFFGALMILAVQFELVGNSKEGVDMLNLLKESQIPFLTKIRNILLARFGERTVDEAEAQLGPLGLSVAQEQLVRSWLTRQCDLTES